MDILKTIDDHYTVKPDRCEPLRDAGSASHAVYSDNGKYFLRIVKPAFYDTAVMGADIQAYLQKLNFPVPPVVFTKTGEPCARTEDGLFILYAFVEGTEPDPERDAQAIGELVGKLHRAMKGYTGALVKRDKYFYIGRYIDILKQKKYPKAGEFESYGEKLWDRIKNLPRGYCHGDMYSGNFHKTSSGQLYVLDFDTSCEGFPIYDPALICNRTHYFDFDDNGYKKSKETFARFLTGYLKYNPSSQQEINAFCEMIALYHFALQATIIEIHGFECVDGAFLDRQLDWLFKWREQCESGGTA